MTFCKHVETLTTHREATTCRLGEWTNYERWDLKKKKLYLLLYFLFVKHMQEKLYVIVGLIKVVGTFNLHFGYT